jgi:hypothetical protein
MNEIQAAVDEYFLRNPINIERVKTDYKNQNKVKLLDDTKKDAYILDVNLAKLYIEKLKIK